MFRAEIEEGTPLGKLAGKLIARGSLVPDDVTVSMVVSRIERPDCCQGFLLDGFPRTLPQAEALEEALAAHNKRLDAVILLEVPDELIVERISGRRVDPLTGEIYHIKYNPPPPEIAGRVIQRPDDTEATCRRRLEKYHSETEAILPFYEARGLLVRVDGTTDTEEVAANVADALAALA